MTKTRKQIRATPKTTRSAPVGSVVYVLDAWDDSGQRSVVTVFATRSKAERALTRLLARPGDWYAGIVRRTIH